MNMIVVKGLTILTFLMIIRINTCEGIRGLNMNRYLKNVNKAIYNACNKEAYIITNNTDVYNCIHVNNSNKCENLENFTEYNKVRFVCIDRNNSEIGSGILISIIIWLIISLGFH
jgi:hypothetical protein